MTNNIEFSSPDENNNNETTPWTKPRESNYQDHVLKPEYAARRLKFPVGQTWFRIVPAIKQSIHSWMMCIHVLNYEGGRYAHPKTLRKNAKSMWDHAYAWSRDYHPESLYSKANKAGVRLLTDPMSVFWAVLEEEGQTVARLFLGSGYDASRGGTPGLGYQIWQLTKDRDENGQLVGDPLHPEKGVLVCVEKTQPKGAKYPAYSLRMGRNPTPMSSLFAKMAPEEVNALCPLESAVWELTQEEEWQCLKRVIAPDIVAKIRSDVQL